jgi:hypothetical protein
MPTGARITLADHMRKVPPAVRPIVKAAVGTVKEIAPRADEVIYQSRPLSSSRTMWKLVRYASGGVYVVGVGTFPGHSTVFFYRGRELDDGSGILQGGGKDMRFITLRAPEDAKRPVVKQLVRKAFKLAAAPAGAVKS